MVSNLSSVSFQGTNPQGKGETSCSKIKKALKNAFFPSKEEAQRQVEINKITSQVRSKGSLAELAVMGAILPANIAPMFFLKKYNENLGAETIKGIEDAASNYIQNSRLKDVVTLNLVEPVKPTIKGLVASFMLPFGLGGDMQIKYGINACFNDVKKEIKAPKGKLPLTLFHEMGHCVNNNFSKIGKFAQDLRMPALIAAVMLSEMGISVFTSAKINEMKKAGVYDGLIEKKEEKEPNKFLKAVNKMDNFVKKHIEKIPLILFAPIIAEEAAASIQGGKIAKEVLKDAPSLVKKVNINNAVALTTYITSALMISLTLLASKKAIEKEGNRMIEEHKQKTAQNQQTTESANVNKT